MGRVDPKMAKDLQPAIPSTQADNHLLAIVARAVSVSPTNIRITERPALEHQSNRLYNVRADERHLILKEYLKLDEWDDAPRREFGALQLLAPLDIAPRPVFCEPAAPPRGPLVAYEFNVPGFSRQLKPRIPQKTQWLPNSKIKRNPCPSVLIRVPVLRTPSRA